MLFFLKKIIVIIIEIFFLDIIKGPAIAEGRKYKGTAEGRCIECANKRLRWRQKILGREKAKGRRRGTKLSKDTT